MWPRLPGLGTPSFGVISPKSHRKLHILPNIPLNPQIHPNPRKKKKTGVLDVFVQFLYLKFNKAALPHTFLTSICDPVDVSPSVFTQVPVGNKEDVENTSQVSSQHGSSDG